MSASLYQRFRDWLPKGTFRPQPGGPLWTLLAGWVRELSGQCPSDTGQVCRESFDANYRGPGCRNTGCPSYKGTDGLAQLADRAVSQIQLLAAEGDFLNLWGSFFNLRRRAETDSQFRYRIIQEAFQTKVTKAALIKALLPFYPGDEDQVDIVEYERPNTSGHAGFAFDTGYAFAGDEVYDLNGPGGSARYLNRRRELALYGKDRADDPNLFSQDNVALTSVYMDDGRFDGFNAQLGLWPYQFRVIVPAKDFFLAAFVFTSEAVTAGDHQPSPPGNAHLAAYAKNAYSANGQNAIADDTAGFRRANANREVRDMIRRIKAAGTQPIYTARGAPPATVYGKV